MGRALEAAPKGGVLDDVVGGAGHARLASGGLAEEIERLRAEPGEGDIAIGGATLAAEAAAFGLIDEYRTIVYPVLVGGGIPFFPQRERRVDLDLVETRTFSSRVVYLRLRVARNPDGGAARQRSQDTHQLAGSAPGPTGRWWSWALSGQGAGDGAGCRVCCRAEPGWLARCLRNSRQFRRRVEQVFLQGRLGGFSDESGNELGRSLRDPVGDQPRVVTTRACAWDEPCSRSRNQWPLRFTMRC